MISLSSLSYKCGRMNLKAWKIEIKSAVEDIDAY